MKTNTRQHCTSLSLFICAVWFVHCSITSHTRCFCLLGLLKFSAVIKHRAAVWLWHKHTPHLAAWSARVCVSVCKLVWTHKHLPVSVWMCAADSLLQPETGAILGSDDKWFTIIFRYESGSSGCWVISCPSVHSSIFSCLSAVGSKWQQTKQISPHVHLPGNIFELLLGDVGGISRPDEINHFSSVFGVSSGVSYQLVGSGNSPMEAT